LEVRSYIKVCLFLLRLWFNVELNDYGLWIRFNDKVEYNILRLNFIHNV